VCTKLTSAWCATSRQVQPYFVGVRWTSLAIVKELDSFEVATLAFNVERDNLEWSFVWLCAISLSAFIHSRILCVDCGKTVVSSRAFKHVIATNSWNTLLSAIRNCTNSFVLHVAHFKFYLLTYVGVFITVMVLWWLWCVCFWCCHNRYDVLVAVICLFVKEYENVTNFLMMCYSGTSTCSINAKICN